MLKKTFRVRGFKMEMLATVFLLVHHLPNLEVWHFLNLTDQIILKGRTLLSHDFVFWCGDFNYRINVGREDAANLVRNNDIETLLSADQLRVKTKNTLVALRYKVQTL